MTLQPRYNQLSKQEYKPTGLPSSNVLTLKLAENGPRPTVRAATRIKYTVKGSKLERVILSLLSTVLTLPLTPVSLLMTIMLYPRIRPFRWLAAGANQFRLMEVELTNVVEMFCGGLEGAV